MERRKANNPISREGEEQIDKIIRWVRESIESANSNKKLDRTGETMYRSALKVLYMQGSLDGMREFRKISLKVFSR